MEKNQTIGIILLSVMMLGYLWLTQDSREQLDKDAEKAKQEIVVKKEEEKKEVIAKATQEDSLALAETPNITPKDITVENEDVIIVFSNKGASVKTVTLKKHKSYTGEPLVLIDDKDNNISLLVESKSEGEVDLSKKYFETNAQNTVVKKGDSTIISFKKSYGNNQYIEQRYVVKGTGYQIDYNLSFIGLDNIFKTKDVNFFWEHTLRRHERGLKESRQRSTINYYTVDDDVNDIGAGNDEEETLEQAAHWISLKQRFFNTAIIAKTTPFKKGASLKADYEEEDTLHVKKTVASLMIPIENMNASSKSFTYYFGPNDYAILKKVTTEFDYNVYLGWGPLALINKYLVVPIFNVLRGFLSNYGIIILLLVIIIKTLLFPIAYKSYLSMAKMKELKPEMDALKEKIGDDQQKMQMESMKLYQETGINPLSGCIPQVLQMPILFALFQFFPNSIELRQQSFLWATDLSTYDAPIILPFEIPFYGAHISIFTLLMTLSTLAYTYYNNQINTQAQGPMKNIGYFMPVIFMFVLNSFSAGLTFYYFVSNLITISQQLIASKFIDKEKIRKIIEENKLKSASGEGKKSGFQKMLSEQFKAAQAAKKKD